jgi:polyvinyl alcohol dehydrogenase (cytochrome)
VSARLASALRILSLSCAIGLGGCGGGDDGQAMNPSTGGGAAAAGGGGLGGTLPGGGNGGFGGGLPMGGDGTTSPIAGNGGVGGQAGVGGVGGGAGGAGGGGVPQVPVRHNWPSFGGDLAHTRYSASETIISAATASELAPAFDIAAPGVTATPALYKGVIYWADWGGFVHATDLETQAELWKVDKSANVGGYTGSPAVTETHVFVANRNGLISALHRENGEVDWEATLDSGVHTHIWSSPVVVEEDNVMIIGVGGYGTRNNGTPLPASQLRTFRGSVVGIDTLTGEEMWTFEVTPEPDGAGVSVWSSAAVDTTRKIAYIGTGNNYYDPVSQYSDSLLAIDYLTGQYKWHAQFTEGDAWTVQNFLSGVDGDVGATPNLFEINGRAVVGVGDKPGRYHVHDRDTGAKVWSVPLTDGSGFQGGVMAPAAYHNGVIYVVSNNGTSSSTVFALSAANNGATIWEYDLIDPTFGGPALGNGVLYVGDQAGNVAAVDASNGDELWTAKLPQGRGGGFSLVDGMLFTGYGFHFSESRREPLMGGLIGFSRGGGIIIPEPPKTDDCVAGTPLTADATFTNVYQGVLCPAGCTKVCHTSSMEGALRIDFKDIAYQSLVGVVAKGAGCVGAGHVLVQPNDPAASVLHGKLALTPQCGLAMPPGATAATTSVTPAMLEAVRAWIAAGAPNN